MKFGKGLLGLAVAAVLILGAASAWAELGSIAERILLIEDGGYPDGVPVSTVKATAWDRQDRAPGSVAQEALEREGLPSDFSTPVMQATDHNPTSPRVGSNPEQQMEPSN